VGRGGWFSALKRLATGGKLANGTADFERVKIDRGGPESMSKNGRVQQRRG
jgi:hypothetical protein